MNHFLFGRHLPSYQLSHLSKPIPQREKKIVLFGGLNTTLLKWASPAALFKKVIKSFASLSTKYLLPM